MNIWLFLVLVILGSLIGCFLGHIIAHWLFGL